MTCESSMVNSTKQTTEHGPSKRHHKKSRNGCVNCKRRKVKCDEGKPTCLNCVRFGIQCITTSTTAFKKPSTTFSKSIPVTGDAVLALRRGRGRPRKDWEVIAEQASEQSSSNDTPASISTPTPLSSSTPFTPTSSLLSDTTNCGLNVSDAEFMLHFISHTAQSLINARSPDDPICRFFTFNVPRIGLKYHFVLHLIYALAGFHLRYLGTAENKSASYIPLIEAHFAAGLSEFRSALQSLDNINCQALYVAATLICYCTFATGPRSPHDFLVCNPDNDHPVPWLPLIHGVRTIRSTIDDTVLFSGLMEPLNPHKLSEPILNSCSDQPTISSLDWQPQLQALRQYIVTGTESYMPACLRAFDALVPIYAANFGTRDGPYDGPAHNKLAFIWFYQLGDEFVTVLQSKESLALLVLAYYTVLLRTMDDHWFMEGWADHLLASSCSIVRKDAAKYLKWPLQQAKLDRKK